MAQGTATKPSRAKPRASTVRRPHGTTRKAILERAMDLASAEGLEGLTIGRLASELGMSKSGLFRHFGSKEGLQLATVDAAAQLYIDRVIAPALEVPEGEERLRVLLERYFSHLEERCFVGGCFWAAAANEFDDRPGAVRDRIRAFTAAWVDLLTREAEAAGAEDPAQLAFELHSYALGANLRSRLLGDREAFRHARRAVERLRAQRSTASRVNH